MTWQFLDLGAPLLDVQSEIDAALARVQEAGCYVLGPELAAFEDEFAAYLGVRHCVGVGSGTDALYLLLRALGVGPGDEVIVPAYTAVATWMAVSMTGATPVGVDVDRDTFLLSAAGMADAISTRTRAVVAVHLFGAVCDIDALQDEIASQDRDIVVLEDSAQAHGARRQQQLAGSLGKAGAFSFYPTKNLGALGDGGAVVTNDASLADRVRQLRSYGWKERSVSLTKGGNSRLDELQAAVLRVKLRRLDRWNATRRELAETYIQELDGIPDLVLPTTIDGVEHAWHLFVVQVPNRPTLAAMLETLGVQTLVHYDPLPHLTPAYRVDGWRIGALPNSEALAQSSLSLPLHPGMTRQDVKGIASCVRVAVGRRA